MWPEVLSEAQLDALKDRTDALLPGVSAIAQRHAWGHAAVERVQDGSLPVFAIGSDLILKLYPSPYIEERRIEACVLERISGHVRCPQVEASGELAGWGYLAMSRLAGEQLVTAWPRIARSNQLRLAEELGQWLRDLHAVPIDGLELRSVPWTSFLAGQYAAATEDQRRRGLGEPWLSQIEGWLATVDLADDRPGVLLQTEMMREHTFVVERHGRWELSGVIDFEPAMLGAREYEFASVGVFLTCGDGSLLRRLLLAYGYREDQLDHDLQRRFLAHDLLHRFRHLAWHLRRVPPAAGVDRLDALAAQWWAFE
jgi:hygromycin-B 7''-O-kinase